MVIMAIDCHFSSFIRITSGSIEYSYHTAINSGVLFRVCFVSLYKFLCICALRNR